MAIAIGIDIPNAFNVIPWTSVRRALFDKGFPAYLKRILEDYLDSRSIEFLCNDGTIRRRGVEYGIPLWVFSSSVVGHLLWNISFDRVLRSRTEQGCAIVSYADDTMIIVTADTARGAACMANIQVGSVLREIEKLGLTVATEKTDAVLFTSQRRRKNMPSLEIRVGTEFVKLGSAIKYLGVIIDCNWKFSAHFSYVEQKVGKVKRALCRLMPNLGGPSDAKRRLYAMVMHSVMLYGSPVWHDVLILYKEQRLRLTENYCPQSWIGIPYVIQ